MVLTPQDAANLSSIATSLGLKFEYKPLIPGRSGSPALFQMVDGICCFLDRWDMSCRCYAQRPLVCRMYPLHPKGLFRCTVLERFKVTGAPLRFPEDLKEAAIRYALTVEPLLSQAEWAYDLDRGWIPTSRLVDKIQLRLS